MVTIKDISKRLGVSPSTVSKALNGYGDIGKDTAVAIREAARSMGYHPNAAAQQLKTNRSHNMGVLFVDETHSGLTHEYFSAVLNSFKNEAEHLGYDITFISNNIGAAPMSYLEHCRYRNCDGVVVACVDFTDPAVAALVGSDIPTVTIDYVFDGRSAVLSDNVQGMRDLVTHVCALGHRRVAFIHGEMTAVTRRRLASFYRTCQELGVEVPPEYVRQARYHDPKQSALATQALLELPERPGCILYPDDYSYLGGATVIEKAGLSVPGDISVAGYDGIPLSQTLRPRLTTMRQDTQTLGRQAALLLRDAIEAPKTYLPQNVNVPAALLPGGTVRDLTGKSSGEGKET